MKTKISRENYLRSYLETAKRLGMEDDETVVAARDEYIAILNRKCQRAVVSAVRALCR